MPADRFKSLPPEALVLGAPLAFYCNRPKNAPGYSDKWRLVLGVFVLAFLFAWSIFCFVVAFCDTSLWPPEKKGEWGFLLPSAWGIGLLLFGFYAVVRIVQQMRVASRFHDVYSFSEGLAIVSRDHVSVIPFDQIASIGDKGHRFQTLDGRTIAWPYTLESSDILADIVMRERFRRLTDRANAALAAGEGVKFGPLLISLEQVAFGDQRLEWSDVIFIFKEEGRIFFIRRGEIVHRGERRIHVLSPSGDYRSPSVLRTDLPNQHVLWPLLELLRPGALEAKLASTGTNPSKSVSGMTILHDKSSDSISTEEGIVKSRVDNSPQDQQRVQPPSETRPALPREGTRGQLLAVCRIPFHVLSDPFHRSWCWTLVGVAPLGIGVYFQSILEVWFDPYCFCLIVVGAVLGLVMFAKFLICLQQVTMRVGVYSNGISYSRGLVRVFCHWEDMREGRWWWPGMVPTPQRGPTPGAYYKLVTAMGQRLKFDVNLDQFYELVDHIERETLRCRLPELLKQFDAGEAIPFTYHRDSALLVSQEGIKREGWTIDWNEITGLHWKDNRLWFTKRGSWNSWGGAPFAQMSNPHLIVPLVEEILRRRDAEQHPHL